MYKLSNKTQSLNLDISFRQLQPNFMRNSTIYNADAFSRRVLANTVQFARIVGGVPSSVYNQQLLALHSLVPVIFKLLVRDLIRFA